MSMAEMLLEKPILIYGAGVIAKIILAYLKADPRIKLLGVAVSGDTTASGEKLAGIAVKPIQDWAVSAECALILIATSEQYHQEITEICRRYGFQDIVPLYPTLKDELVLSYHREFYRKKGISLDGPYFCIGDMRYLNPLKHAMANGINLFDQIGDFVLPNEYGEWETAAEGPYDWGDVTLRPGDVVLDCGANLGVFSVYAASKGCKVYAFEPTPALLPVLKRQSELNHDRIIPVPYAVSNQNGSTAFFIDQYSCGGSSLLKRSADAVAITVQQITLDMFVEQERLRRVDFIKADIEGAERWMLSGAQEVLARFAPKLSLCTYHLPDDQEVLAQLIMDANPNYKISFRWQKLYAHV